MKFRTRVADPAAEQFTYEVSGDVRDLISVDDAVEELDLGPNGCDS
jgi:GPN-loop GTPase